MKKVLKMTIIVAVALGIVALLIIPGKEHLLDDGGSRYRKSILRMEAEWYYLRQNGDQTVSRVYWFPETLKSIEKLKDEGSKYLQDQFIATVLEINGNSVLVELSEGSARYYGTDKITFGIAELEKLDVRVGSQVKVTFDGEIMESYPAQIKAIHWELLEK